MSKQTAMQQMYDELIANEFIIPLDLIVKCKELIKMEREQIENAFRYNVDVDLFDSSILSQTAQQYYNEIYGGQDEK